MLERFKTSSQNLLPEEATLYGALSALPYVTMYWDPFWLVMLSADFGTWASVLGDAIRGFWYMDLLAVKYPRIWVHGLLGLVLRSSDFGTWNLGLGDAICRFWHMDFWAVKYPRMLVHGLMVVVGDYCYASECRSNPPGGGANDVVDWRRLLVAVW